jgi:E3 ubiquitin-protein ligase RAD18
MAGAANFLNESVPDPTDFPPQTIAPGLRKLDATFRCSICGDTYDAPVTLPCGHCFCSGVSLREISLFRVY